MSQLQRSALSVSPRSFSSTQPEKAYRLLRAILNVAVDDEKIRVNPCRIKGGGKESAPERPIAVPETVLATADAIDPQYHALVILAAWCSLRFGELAGLRRSRIDLLHRQIHVLEQAIELAGGKVAMVAECIYKGRRLVVRRTRLTGPQATLWPGWRHFAFLSDLAGTAVELDAFHRRHAVVELCIDDWKEGRAWSTAPRGYFSVPARLVNRSGTPTLRGPTLWPWAASFTRALTNLRSVTFAPT
jgi:integrase